MLLHATNLTKTFGAVTVLTDVSFALHAGERVGLVGANGAGKTTLLRLLLGTDIPDAGEMWVSPSTTIGYLPQSSTAHAGQTIDEAIRDAVGELRRMEERMRAVEAAMTDASTDALPTLLDEYGALSTRFQDRGGYDLDHRIDTVLDGLGLRDLPRDRVVATLSGGEQARIGLAALLLRAPDILLLDEPTNHLDGAALAWLESYLATYTGAILAVSHDRWFLNRTVNRIFEIDDLTHQLRRYEGDYDAYASTKAAERARWEERYSRQQEEIAELRRRIKGSTHQVAHNRGPSDGDKLVYNFKGGNVDRAVARNVRAAEDRLARIEADPIEKPPKPMRFQPRFAAAQIQSRQVLVLEDVTKVLGGRALLRDASLIIGPHSRLLLTGPNGAGKTTLLRILLGLEAPDLGHVRRAPGTQVGYLPQEPLPVARDCSVLDVYREGLVGPEGTIVASILGNGLFRLEDLAKPVGALSLGQRRKLEIARLVAARPNALVLDEPTNYLSLDVLAAFESAVLEFPGPVLVVSHDRWFIQRFGGDTWVLEGRRLYRRDG